MEALHFVLGERAQVEAFAGHVSDDLADDLMGVPEGHAGTDEELRQVGGEKHRVRRRFRHPLPPHVEGRDRPRHDLEGVAQRLDGVEQRFLVFLEVPVVRERQALQDREQRDEVADRPSGLAAHDLGHVRVLLLGHQARARRIRVRQLDEAELARRPEDELLGESGQMDHRDRRVCHVLERQIP